MRIITASRSLHTTTSINGRGVKFESHLKAVERRKWRFAVRFEIQRWPLLIFIFLETTKSWNSTKQRYYSIRLWLGTTATQLSRIWQSKILFKRKWSQWYSPLIYRLDSGKFTNRFLCGLSIFRVNSLKKKWSILTAHQMLVYGELELLKKKFLYLLHHLVANFLNLH